MNFNSFIEIKEFEKDLFTEEKKKKSKIIIKTQIDLTSQDLELLEEIVFLIRRGVEEYYDKLIKNLPKLITQRDLSSVIIYITDNVDENDLRGEALGSYIDKEIFIKKNVIEDFLKLIKNDEFTQTNFIELTELVRTIAHEYVHAIQDLNGLLDYYESLPQEFKYYNSPIEKEAVYVATVLTEKLFKSGIIRKIINRNGYRLGEIENIQLEEREEKIIEKLVKIFEELIFEEEKFKEDDFPSSEETYSIFLKKIKESGVDYSCRDIENLSKNLRIRLYKDFHYFYEEKIGIFFSALINNKMINDSDVCYLDFRENSLSFIDYRLFNGEL